MILPATCRAGRALVGLTQAQLAAAASVGLSTIKNFEAGSYEPILNNRRAIQAALEAVGVEFVEDGSASAPSGPGVRLRRPA